MYRDDIEYPHRWEEGRARRIKANRRKTGERKFIAEHPDIAWLFLPYLREPDDIEEQEEYYKEYWKVINRLRLPKFLFEAREEWGGLTEKQAQLVYDRLAKIDEQEKKWAEEDAAAPAWEAGRQEVRGVILSIREERTHYTYYGETSVKGLVKLEDGRKLWTTIPRAAWDKNKGDTIALRVTVEPKEGESYFGFGKRPTLLEE